MHILLTNDDGIMAPGIVAMHPGKDPLYHHAAYDIARIFALDGDRAQAVKWLREAHVTGFRPYPLFERDHYRDRIRTSPEFVRFLAEAKAAHLALEKGLPPD